ncbi:MAG TPA: Crp/Fnr family transcriptional regulator [Pyrinomonadaceae bacterium]|nr:Crp/Fnr family transcriptional regulator [Pyrinomonadaceae bacterium]
MLQKSIPIKNLILAGLSRKEYGRLLPNLESVALPPGEKLYKSGDAIEHVYFPGDGLVSLVTHMNDGTTVEVGLIGRDGMVGIPVLLGDDIAFEEAIVQIEGSAMRMKSGVFKDGLKRNHNPLLTQLLLYTRALMRQVGQTAACNRIHTVEERLSRWLLMCHDRLEADELPLTQEFISNMLGTRRASVGTAATGLQTEGLIRYSRGHISILDRKGLEETSCECYQAAKA